MNEIIHKESAKEHFRIAKELDKKYTLEKNQNKKIAIRTVAAQNYFYARINVIEAILAIKELHSFNHENRARKVFENPDLFNEEILTLFNLVDRDIRNKIAYRGENGEKYKNIKKFAEKLIEHGQI